MDELIKAMSDQELLELKAKHEGNASLGTMIDGIIEVRQHDAIQAKLLDDFAKGIQKTFAKLAHPENIYNVYVRWAEVDVEKGEAEEVEVTDDKGVTTKVMRIPTVKEYQWVIEVNHAIRQSAGSGADAPKTSKRAITVFKRNGTNLEPKGNFASASKACDYLKLVIGGDSATRVLARDGYISEAYDGSDYVA